MSKISTSDGIMLYYLWVKCPLIWFWNDCTIQNYRILFNFRLCWLWEPELTTTADSCKNFILIIWWELETSESGTRLWKGDQTPWVKKERKPTLRGKWESVSSGRHMDSDREETHVVSVMSQGSLETVAKVRDTKDDRLLLHPSRRQNRLTAMDKNLHTDQAVNRQTRWIRVKFHADSNSHKKYVCKFWHPPVCVNYRSEKGCLREQGKMGSKHTVKFSKGTWHQIKKRERKGPSWGIIQRCVSHERSLCAPKFWERSHEETLHPERCAAKKHGIWRKIFTSSRNAGAYFKETRGVRIRSWFRSINAHDEQKELSSERRTQ